MTEKELHACLGLEIGERRMRAILVPRTNRPPRGIGVGDLHRFLVSCGVRHGIDRENLKAILSAWKLGESGPWIAAEGTEATSGRANGLDRIPPPPRSGRDEVELLPLYVRRGDRLFRHVSAIAPSPGQDVLGALVPPPDRGETPPLAAGRGISIEDDGTWVARATGFLHVEDGQLLILKTLLHSHVLGPGNYRWPGDARISGGIAAGTTLEVGGHLQIEGDVGHGVQLRAEGDLRVDGVVDGGGSARLEAEGRMKLHDATDAQITAGGDLVVTGTLDGCRVRTRGRFLGDDSECVVVGGTIEAIAGAELHTVRADGSHDASIAVGRASWVNDEMRAVEAEIRRWVNYHGKLFQDFRSEHGEYAENRSLLWQVSEREREAFYRDEDEVHAEQQRVDQRISRLRSRLEALASSRSFDPKAVVHIRGTAEAGTRITVRGRRYDGGRKPLSRVAIGIFGETKRVCAVPSALFLSSEMH